VRRIIFQLGIALGLLAIGMFVVGPVAADKPSWAGNSKSDKQSQKKAHSKQNEKPKKTSDKGSNSGGQSGTTTGFLIEVDRAPIDYYYAEQFRSGKCPPGLAKKGNGCRPPGHAKNWVLYQPLPAHVIYYDLPPTILFYLGPPPSGHRFVRVAQDILLITAGTGMVIDAIEDMGMVLGQ